VCFTVWFCAFRTTSNDVHRETVQPSVDDRKDSSDVAERKVSLLKLEVESLRRQLAERDGHFATIDNLRLSLEKRLSSQVAEISVSSQTHVDGSWEFFSGPLPSSDVIGKVTRADRWALTDEGCRYVVILLRLL